MELHRIKDVVSAWAAQVPEIQKVYLYGSRVKGTHRESSDIDIAIEFDPKVISRSGDVNGMATWFFHKEKWQAELQREIPIRVQLEWFHPELTRVVRVGLAEGSILVYEKPQACD